MGVYFLNAEFGYSQAVIDGAVLRVSKYLGQATKDLNIKHPFDVVNLSEPFLDGECRRY